MLKADSLKLPEKIDGWQLDGPPQTITKENIFDYMDGGGELYLAYKFNRLEVWRYRAEKESEEEILVEVYEMQHPDEAYGLLSLDWTGEPVVLNPEVRPLPESPVSPSYTALYGEGLLRARVDNLYLRILAPRESPEIKEIILKLGKIIAGQAPHPSPSWPEILKLIQPVLDSGWKIKKDRTSYFHSYLVLNSLFYLSQENLLRLSPECQAIYTEWANNNSETKKSARLIVIEYPNGDLPRLALTDFLRAYFPENPEMAREAQSIKSNKAVRSEEGWLGWKLSERYLALVFEVPDENSMKELLGQTAF